MAAPTIAALLDYETNIEDAIAAYLATTFSSYQVLTPRTAPTDEAKLRTPRFDVSLSMTGSGTPEHDRTTDSKAYESFKSGALTIRAAVRRGASGQSLGTLRGQLRKAMLPATLALTAIAIPYYEITHIQEAGSSPQTFAGNDEIISDLTWTISWFIKPDQWPAS